MITKDQHRSPRRSSMHDAVHEPLSNPQHKGHPGPLPRVSPSLKYQDGQSFYASGPFLQGSDEEAKRVHLMFSPGAEVSGREDETLR